MFQIKIDLKFMKFFFILFLEVQVGTKRDNLTVDACTNRINSLLFKVKLGVLPIGINRIKA